MEELLSTRTVEENDTFKVATEEEVSNILRITVVVATSAGFAVELEGVGANPTPTGPDDDTPTLDEDLCWTGTTTGIA